MHTITTDILGDRHGNLDHGQEGTRKGYSVCVKIKTYLYNGGYSSPQIIHILRLLGEDVGDHLRQQSSVGMTIEGTQVQQFGNIKQEVLIDDLTKHFWSQPVLLIAENSNNVVSTSRH